MKNISCLLLVMFLSLTSGCTGCMSEVPGGYVGMVKTSSGFTGDVLAPGRHSCYGYDTMYLLEVSDQQFIMHLNQLCTDQVNFKFDIGILFSVDRSNNKAIQDAFSSLTPAKETTITAEQLFNMYVAPLADQEARGVISQYATSQIVGSRPKIVAGVDGAVRMAFKLSLIEIKQVTMNNDDFPEFVTKAQEEKVKRRVEIETEGAEQEKRVIIAENNLKIAELQYKVELVEASMIADSNKIIGSSITGGYLAWWQLKVLGEAAKGPNNWGFIPYNDFVNHQPETSKLTERLSPEGVVDAALIQRIQEAKNMAQKMKAEDDAKAAAVAAKAAAEAKVKEDAPASTEKAKLVPDQQPADSAPAK